MKGGWGVGGGAAEVTLQEKSLFYVHIHDMYVCMHTQTHTHTHTYTQTFTQMHTQTKKKKKNVLNREKKQEVLPFPDTFRHTVQWHLPRSQRKVPRACEGGHGLQGFPPCQSPPVHLLHQPPGMTTYFDVSPHQINIPCNDHMFSKYKLSKNNNKNTIIYHLWQYAPVSDCGKPTFSIYHLLQKHVSIIWSQKTNFLHQLPVATKCLFFMSDHRNQFSSSATRNSNMFIFMSDHRTPAAFI